jgi:hypothetical protein
MGDAKMTEDGNHTVAELDAERRAIGRQHTAQLLKMLRGGYGTTPEPESVAEVDPAAELKPCPGRRRRARLCPFGGNANPTRYANGQRTTSTITSATHSDGGRESAPATGKVEQVDCAG